MIQFERAELFIAPMWNLNCLKAGDSGINGRLFIAPMWNLNEWKWCQFTSRGMAFYCTYVEFKLFQFSPSRTHGGLFIAPMWNLNGVKLKLILHRDWLFIAPMWNLNQYPLNCRKLFWDLFIAPMWNLNTNSFGRYKVTLTPFYCTYVEFKPASRRILPTNPFFFLLHLCGI